MHARVRDTVAGTGTAGATDGGALNLATFDTPLGLALDSDDITLYIADE